jgi:tetratricopeptide (TPR) repeat protein
MLLTIQKNYLRVIFFTAVLLFSISTASAHIEQGTMPDSVAEMEYRILLEFEPDNLEVRNLLGMVLYRSGKLEEAEAEFHYVLKRAPENLDAIDALGLVNIKRQNYQFAIDLFKKAIAINPDDMLVYYHLGQALELQGDFTGAAEAYRTGLAREVTGPHKKNNDENRRVLLDALKTINDKVVKNEEQNL